MTQADSIGASEETKDEPKANSVPESEAELSESDRAIVAKARESYGKKIAFWYDEEFGLVVIARKKGANGEAEFNRLVNDLQEEGKDRAVTLRTFALACGVYPEREQLKKIFSDNPAFALLVAGRAQQLAGSKVKELGKA